MLTHIVIFTWNVGTCADQVDDLRRALDDLAAVWSGRATFSHGPDLGFREHNGDYALVATLADRAAWDEYQADPRHKAIVREHVTPMQASRLTIQF